MFLSSCFSLNSATIKGSLGGPPKTPKNNGVVEYVWTWCQRELTLNPGSATY